MAISKSDREIFRLIVSEVIDEKLTPVYTKTEEHASSIQRIGQTVYGETGNNGLRGEIRTIKTHLNRFYVIGGIAQGVSVGIGIWIDKMFLSGK